MNSHLVPQTISLWMGSNCVGFFSSCETSTSLAVSVSTTCPRAGFLWVCRANFLPQNYATSPKSICVGGNYTMDLLKEFKAICEVKIYNSVVWQIHENLTLSYFSKQGRVHIRLRNQLHLDIWQGCWPTTGYIYFTNYGRENMLFLLSCKISIILYQRYNRSITLETEKVPPVFVSTQLNRERLETTVEDTQWFVVTCGIALQA